MSLSKPKPAYLKDPSRIAIISGDRLVHGETKNHPFIKFLLEGASDFVFVPYYPSPPEIEKEIYLKDFTIGPHVHYNKFIEFTVIEDPYHLGETTVVIVEDKNKDVGDLILYRFPQNEFALKALEHGTILRVGNPMGRVSDAKVSSSTIEPSCTVVDANAITVLGKKINMCRYCGEENATRKCSLCKRHYCDRECQREDWQILKHRHICKLSPSSYF